jgi:hypothetical protein
MVPKINFLLMNYKWGFNIYQPQGHIVGTPHAGNSPNSLKPIVK